MVEVIVFAEGQSDEQFLKRVVAPSLREHKVFLKPLTLNTSKNSSGGAVSFDRLRFNVRNTLRQSGSTYLTTFLDLYALDTGMPGQAMALAITDPLHRASHIEAALHAALVDDLGFRAERFLPYVQPYELEGLFFSSAEAIARSVPGWQSAEAELLAVRRSFSTPEHVNDGYATKPSARLEAILRPRYRKTTHAPLIGEHVGLTAITQQCAHFAQWVEQLRRLQPL